MSALYSGYANPLLKSLKYRNNTIANLLLDNPAIDVKCSENELRSIIATPLILAVENNNIQIVERLLKFPDIEINFDGERCNKIPIGLAVEQNSIDIVKLLIGRLEAKLSAFGLALAIRNGFNEIAEMFVKDIRCDINEVVVDEYQNILIYAIRNKAYSAIEAMLDSHRLKKIDKRSMRYYDEIINIIDERLANRIKNELYDESL